MYNYSIIMNNHLYAACFSSRPGIEARYVSVLYSSWSHQDERKVKNYEFPGGIYWEPEPAVEEAKTD